MALTRFPVHLFFDVISPYSWIGFEILSRYKKLWEKMDLTLRPCSIQHVIKNSGNETPFSNARKLSYQFKDIHLVANYSKVPLKIPSNFAKLALEHGTVPTLKFLTAMDSLSGGKETEKIARRLWRAIFTNEPAPNPNTPEVWLEAGRNAKMDSGLLHEAIVQAETKVVKSKLIATSREANDLGGFGLPLIVVRSSEGPVTLFGSDRIEQLAYIIGEKYEGPNPLEKKS